MPITLTSSRVQPIVCLHLQEGLRNSRAGLAKLRARFGNSQRIIPARFYRISPAGRGLRSLQGFREQRHRSETGSPSAFDEGAVVVLSRPNRPTQETRPARKAVASERISATSASWFSRESVCQKLKK